MGSPFGDGKSKSFTRRALVISGNRWSRARLRYQNRAAVIEEHHRRNVEDVLVGAQKEKYVVVLDGAAHREPELLLPVRWIESDERIGRTEHAVAEKVKRAAVNVIRARLGDYIDHRAASA